MSHRRGFSRWLRPRWLRRGHLALLLGAGVAIGGGDHGLPKPSALAALVRGVTLPHHGVTPSLAASPPLLPPSAARLEEPALDSAAVGRTLPYRVYLPPGYDSTPDQRFPVLYMLHGWGGDERQWERLGLLTAAERMIRAGELPPLIIVMPRGEQAYWMDHSGGGPRWGRYVAAELVAEVDRRYRTEPVRERRMIGGLSMGGHGALQLALNNPGTFGAVGAHSLVLRRYAEAPQYFGDEAYFRRFDPVSIIRSRPESARGPALWIDIGTADGWRERAEAFHLQLEAAGITHGWQLAPGGHDDAYWTANMETYLRFYAAALRNAR